MLTIYLAGPVFSLGEREFNLRLSKEVEALGPFEVILPQERAKQLLSKPDGLRLVYQDCLDSAAAADAVLAVLDGSDADSGTCVELGYARALGKYIVGVRTDFRGSEDRGLNLMASHVCDVLIAAQKCSIRELAARIVTHLPGPPQVNP